MFTDADKWDGRGFTFPLYWHSDGGEVYTNKSYVTYHISTPFTHNQNPKDAKLLMLSIPEKWVTSKTEQELCDVFISWQKALSLGRFSNGRAGDVAGGYRFAFSAWTGDLKAGLLRR